MQFLTLKWSGLWRNIDICYASFYGCPNLKVINGNHYIGPKPWQLKNRSVRNSYSQYEDYKYWYHVFIEMIDKNPNLKAIEWYDQVVVDTYMSYPLGSDNYWGFPLEGDTMVLFVRKDKLLDPAERDAFKAKYGFDLPKSFEDFEALTYPDFEKMLEFFTRPEQDFYGIAQHYSKVDRSIILHPHRRQHGKKISRS